MKRVWIIISAMLLAGFAVQAAPKSEVRQAVYTFVQSGDAQNVGALDQVLHPEFRVVFQAKGSNDVSNMAREQFLEMFRQKKFGGDQRSVKIRKIDVQGNLAVVRARFQGRQAVFENTLTLVRGSNGWQVIQDMAYVEFSG